MESSDALIKQAIAEKQRGNYAAAIALYQDAMQSEPDNMMIYYGLGKLFYLVAQPGQALAHYLTAMHYSLLGIEERLKTDKLFKNYADTELSAYTQDIIDFCSEVHSSARYMLLDANTPRHIGHALLDFNTERDPALEEHIKRYRLSLAGDESADINDEIEADIYVPAGLDYCVENIQWKNFSAGDIFSLYVEE